MEWSRDDIINVTTISNDIRLNTSITSTLTLSLKSDDNDVTFVCKTFFNDVTNNKARTQVRNVPAYEFAWKFMVNVLCEYSLLKSMLMY